MSKKKKQLSQTRFLMNSMIHSFNSTVIIPLFEWMQSEVSFAYPDYQKLDIKNIIFKEPTDNPYGHIYDHRLETAVKHPDQSGYSILRSSKFSPRSGLVVSKTAYDFPYGANDKDLQGVNAFEKDVPLYIIEFIDKEFYTSKYGFRYWRNLKGKEKDKQRLFYKFHETEFHTEIDRYNEVSFFYFSKLGIILANIINDHYGKDICHTLINFFDIFKKGFFAYNYERLPILNWWRPCFSNLADLYDILDEVHKIHSYISYLDKYIHDYLIESMYCYGRASLSNLIGREMSMVLYQFMKNVLRFEALDLPFIDKNWDDENTILVHDPYYSMTHFRQKHFKENDEFFGLSSYIKEDDCDIFEIIYNHNIIHDMCDSNENIHYDDFYASIFLHELNHLINYHTQGIFTISKYFHQSLDPEVKVNLLEFLSLEADIDDSKIKELLGSNERFTLTGENIIDNPCEYEAEKFSILLRQIICTKHPEEYRKLIKDFDSIFTKWLNS